MASKTYSFEEALRALTEGKCDGIQYEGASDYAVLNDRGVLVNRDGGHLVFAAPLLLGNWYLIHLEPAVIISGFLNIYDNGVYFHFDRDVADRSANDRRISCIPLIVSRLAT